MAGAVLSGSHRRGRRRRPATPLPDGGHPSKSRLMRPPATMMAAIDSVKKKKNQVKLSSTVSRPSYGRDASASANEFRFSSTDGAGVARKEARVGLPTMLLVLLFQNGIFTNKMRISSLPKRYAHYGMTRARLIAYSSIYCRYYSVPVSLFLNLCLCVCVCVCVCLCVCVSTFVS